MQSVSHAADVHTQSVAFHVSMLMKYHLRQQRPIDYAPEVQPLIQTPDHSSFPAGHAIQAFAIATVLDRFMWSSYANDIEEKIFYAKFA